MSPIPDLDQRTRALDPAVSFVVQDARRVLEALRDSAGPKPEKSHAALTWELARSVRDRGKSLGWDPTQNPARLCILTIDSLSASLTRQMPWLSRLGGPPDILEDAEDLYAEAAR